MTLDTEEWDEITARLINVQRALVSGQEQQRHEQRAHIRGMDELCLGLIEVLDLVEILQAEHTGYHHDKVARRIDGILKRQRVRELTVTTVVPHNVKVIETRASSAHPAGTVLEVCRKGYQRDERILRAAEVIASR